MFNIDKISDCFKEIEEAKKDSSFDAFLTLNMEQLLTDYQQHNETCLSNQDESEAFTDWALQRFINEVSEKNKKGMKNYTFKIFIGGLGRNATEALEDAIQGFIQEPGNMEKESIEHVEEV